MKLKLPTPHGHKEPYKLVGEPLPIRKPRNPFNRVAFAASHVVANPYADSDPSGSPAIDWERTLG